VSAKLEFLAAGSIDVLGATCRYYIESQEGTEWSHA
jgi:hypothetical protein